jgi:aminopeptidase N
MLEQALGDSAFDRGMRRYIAAVPGDSAGISHLTRALSAVSGRNVGALLRAWLEETTIPDVRARIDGRRIIVEQSVPFEMPIEIEIIAASDTTHRTVWLRTIADTIALAMTPTTVRLDPSNRLLLKRHWGEQIRFRVHAPDAREVQLLTDFSRTPLPAARRGDEWVVEVPLSAGRYQWWWRVDGRFAPAPAGDPPRSGVIDVRPLVLLEAPIP